MLTLFNLKEHEKKVSNIKRIIVHVLIALYQSFLNSILVAVLFMFLCLYARERGWKEVFCAWIYEFKVSVHFRCTFLLAFYTMMILIRTLFIRNMWDNLLSNMIGVWGLYNAKGELTTEVIENLILFIPFVILLLVCFRAKILDGEVRLIQIVCKAIKITFIFLLAIEVLQLFLRLETFQLSDLFYNTLGGLIGGVAYWIGVQFKKK